MSFEFDRFMTLDEAWLNLTMAGLTPENLERMRAYIRSLLEAQREACGERLMELHRFGGEMGYALAANHVRSTPLVEIH